MTIKDFMEASGMEKGTRVEIRGKIVTCLEYGSFSFIDTSACVPVKALQKFSGQIVPGKFVKLINPELDEQDTKSLKLSGKSLIVPTRRIKELADTEFKAKDSNDCPSLEMVGTLDPNEKVSEVKVIVLKDLGTNNAGPRKTPVKKILVKDKDKTEGTLSIWAHFREKIEVGRIYRITNMRVEKYPKEKPHQISTTMATKITDVTDEENSTFKGISLVDGSYAGYVEAIHDIYKYECCPKCKCKVDNTMAICATCRAVLHQREETFKYGLCLNPGDDNMINIIGFRPSVQSIFAFPNPLPSIEDIEDELNNSLERKSVDVQYTINKKNKEKIVYKINVN